MSKSRIGKAGLASLAVTGLVSSGLLFTAGTANAVPGFEFDRIAGSDRFATSALVAEQIGDGANAILANGQRGQFADALSANYLAGDLDAPVYLTRQNNTPDSIANQLEENGVENITVVGGNGAVSEEQVAALEADGYNVTRVSGATRFETNAEIINEVGAAPEDTALVATGLNFADALAGGPLAENGYPLGLASQNGVPDAVIDALTDAGVDSAIVIGGESAVGAGAVADLEDAGIDVITRLSGTGRAETSVEVAEYGVANLGLTDTAVNLASGDAEGSGADALSGGVLTGQQARPLLITQSVNNPSDAVRGYISDNSDTLVEGTIFGGDAAVSLETQAELEELGQGEDVPGDNDNLDITPQDDVQLGDDENRVYTVTGLDPEQDYRVTLVNTDNFEEDADGNATFTEDGDTGLAAAGTVLSDITVVNGVPTANPDATQSVGGISPDANGTITFTVNTDSGNAEEFAPVIYTDQGGANTRLNIDDEGSPEEPYGIGGSIQTAPEEAPTGYDDGYFAVNFVDKAEDVFFTEDDFSFNYDGNDQYFVTDDNGNFQQATLADFEAELSVDDQIYVEDYQRNSELVSTFYLFDVAPAEPFLEQPTDDDVTDTSVTLTVDETTLSDDVDSVTVYGEEEDTAGVVAPVDADESEVYATATEDADPDTDGFQIVVDGLTAETNYAFAVTQTVDDEESPLSNEVLVTTDATADPITITSAVLTTDDVVEGEVDDTDVWTLTFSDDLDASAADGSLTLRGANGGTFIVDCGLPVADDDVTSATCVVDGDELEITILEPAERRNSGDAEITYPATITAVDGIGGAGAGQDDVDLAASADVVVD